MNTLTVIIVVLVVVIVAIGAWFLLRERRSRGLRQRFGPEYERSVANTEDRRAAEADLLEREKRHRDLDVRPLSDDERAGFDQRWSRVQQGFVDDPGLAVRGADALVDDVMRARGYPVEDFEQRAADVSVEHPIVVQRYREARLIAEANDAGQASTEDLRQAVTSYRALIVALLEPDPAEISERRAETPVREPEAVADHDVTDHDVTDHDVTDRELTDRDSHDVADPRYDRTTHDSAAGIPAADIPAADDPAAGTRRETRA